MKQLWETIKSTLTITVGGYLSFENLQYSIIEEQILEHVPPMNAIIGLLLGFITLIYTILKVNEMLCTRRERIRKNNEKHTTKS